MALNGGPEFKFSPAISFVVHCKTQKKLDYYWDKLLADGAPSQCGWLTDKFGVSWQIVPTLMDEMLRDPDVEKTQRAMKAVLGMGKIDIAEVQRAAEQG
jgi:predicted 3-demethylubiquinone-9 3-methyltransferase (glyoxalase superfamily)